LSAHFIQLAFYLCTILKSIRPQFKTTINLYYVRIKYENKLNYVKRENRVQSPIYVKKFYQNHNNAIS